MRKNALFSFLPYVISVQLIYQFFSVRESGLILLQSIPNYIDVDGLTKKLRDKVCMQFFINSMSITLYFVHYDQLCHIFSSYLIKLAALNIVMK